MLRRLALVLVCTACTHVLWAQYTVGRVEGTVMDPTGAVLSGALVTLLNRGTNATRTFTTGRDGYFTFFALPPGRYLLSAASAKFAKRSVELEVSSNQTVTRNLELEVGPVATKLDVTDSARGTETNSSDAQRTVTRSEVELSSLPSPARNMISTVQLGPGISPTNNPRGGSTFGGGGSFVIVLGVQSGLIAANGGRARATSVQLDYTDANDWEAGGFAPGMQAITPDMLEEFKILTSNFSAEYGVKSNAQVIMVTKSGTNFLHGKIYDFLQNDAFNARDYFDTTGKASLLKQNIYGVTLGGPLLRNRTFLFGGYEGRKTRGGSFTNLAQVPTTTAAKAAVPVIAEVMNRLLPKVDGSGDVGTVAVQIPSPVDNYQFVLKGDHQLSSGHRISARYLQGTASFVARFPSQNTLRGFDVDNHFELRNANLTDTISRGDGTVNELRLSYGRTLAAGSPQNGLNTPRFQITNLVNFGALASVPTSRLFNVLQANDVLTHLRNTHVLRVGADVRKIQDSSVSAANSRGVFTFASLNDFLKGQPSLWTQLFGDTRRDFRTGVYALFAQDDWKIKPTLTINAGLRWEMQGALSEANDRTSVLDPGNPGMIGAAGTGPLGSFHVGGAAVEGNWRNLAPRVGFAWNPGGGDLVVRGGYGLYWDSFNFTPLAASRSVPPLNYTRSLSCVSASAPSCAIVPLGANSFDKLLNGTAAIQTQTLAQLGGFGSLLNFGSVTTVDAHLPNPYVQQFSFGIEERLPGNAVFTLGYVGAKGTHLTRLSGINPLVQRPAPATSIADETARLSQFQAAAGKENGAGNSRLDPRFDQVNLHEAGGSSIYHSLQAELRRSLARGLQFQASYTWAKSIDNASDYSPTIQANDNSFAQDAANSRAERAVSNFDIAHRVLVTAIWQVPFFRGLPGLAGRLLDGWSFESVNVWQTGIPATLLAGTRRGIADVNLDGNLIPTGLDNTRPNCNLAGTNFEFGKAATIPAPGLRGVNGAANPSNFAYTQPLLGNDGTCGRNNIRMNHLANFDWSVFKETTLVEGGFLGSAPLTLQLRLEAINVFNVPFLTAQGDNWRTIASPVFGLFNAAGATRRIQLAARFSW